VVQVQVIVLAFSSLAVYTAVPVSVANVVGVVPVGAPAHAEGT
jgi:hypothetical protein